MIVSAVHPKFLILPEERHFVKHVLAQPVASPPLELIFSCYAWLQVVQISVGRWTAVKVKDRVEYANNNGIGVLCRRIN